VSDALLNATHIGATELAAAHDVIGRHLRPTPLVRLTGALTDTLGEEVWVKLEVTQPTGSFKVRGALAAAAAYQAGGRRIVTASAGNHGLGVAYAATVLGIDATVVVPRTASPAKIDALQRFPIDLQMIGDDYDEAEQAALSMAATGGQYVSAYNDRHVIAGQATMATEVIAQHAPSAHGPFTLVVPVGGGGLLTGSLLASRKEPGVRVIGVETAASRAVSTAASAGRVVPVDVGRTIADGLAGNIADDTVSPAAVRITRTDLVAAPEAEIRRAVTDLATHAGLMVEGSAAVGLAALRVGHIPTDRPIVLALTGRNISPTLMIELLGEAAGKVVDARADGSP
jgi:threonine dehydratase